MITENLIIYAVSIFAVLDIIFVSLFSNNGDDNVVYMISDDEHDSNSLGNEGDYEIIPAKLKTINVLSQENNDYYLGHNINKNIHELPGQYVQYQSQYNFEKIKYCHYILNQLRKCLLMDDGTDRGCSKLYDEEIRELAKCDWIYSNYDVKNKKKEIEKFVENGGNLEENEILDFFHKKEEIEEVIEDEGINFNKEEKIVEEGEEEEGDNTGDCVEYTLSEQDNNYIVCTKYE